MLVNKARRIRRKKIPGYGNVKAPVEDTDWALLSLFKVALTRPWKILIDPISFLVAIYYSVVYTSQYMLFTTYPFIFREKRGWNSSVGELPLIGVVIGPVLGGLFIFAVSARDRKRLQAGHIACAEDRSPVAMVGGVIFPVTMFWLGWSGEYNSVHWIVPSITAVFLSASILLICVGYLNYLTDTYLMYAESAIAVNTVCRSAIGASAPLFTKYMFDALGVGWGGSLIGGVAVLLASIPFIFYRYGEPIRKRSKFAPTPQKLSNTEAPDAKNPLKEKDAPGEAAQGELTQTLSLSSSIPNLLSHSREVSYYQEGYVEAV